MNAIFSLLESPEKLDNAIESLQKEEEDDTKPYILYKRIVKVLGEKLNTYIIPNTLTIHSILKYLM